MNLKPLFCIELGQPLGQCRTTPVNLGPARPRAFLSACAADFDVDPYYEMFFFPTDTLKLICFTDAGEVLWRRDLGKAVVPGMWFCPLFPFDMDGDGVDEIYFVNNIDPKHPLAHTQYRLERLNARTGETTGQWQWPTHNRGQNLSHAFRHFIIGGHVGGEPVLVTAQGTYGAMFLQGWRPDMTLRWEKSIAATDAGARGSHMCPIIDLDGDGRQQLLWGERCIELDTGHERFCADRDHYAGHSDVIAPLLDRARGKWFIYTIRESDAKVSPRVALFDANGQRVWGAVDEGHMDMGWVAHLAGYDTPTAMAIRIGHKTCGPDGRFHVGMTEFCFDALTGAPRDLGFRVYQTIPVDLNGDGYHELVRGIPGGDGVVLDGRGEEIGRIEGTVALAQKLVDHAGEQILSYTEDGRLLLYADADARDSERAQRRYANSVYQANRRPGATGSNASVQGGI
jgi:hypothetical protein